MGTFPYVVKQGDYLTKLAFERGLTAEEVWEAPENAGLRDTRASMDVLAPGDILHFPAPSGLPPSDVTPGQVNTYAARVPLIKIRLRVLDPDGAPVANTSYAMSGGGLKITGKTDGNGVLDVEANVFARELRVSFENRSFVLAIRVGHMDPASDVSGIAKRLMNLGLLRSAHDVAGAGIDPSIIATFQGNSQLPVTGELDEVTVRSISDEYGI